MILNINDIYKCVKEVRQLGYPVCKPGDMVTVVSSTDKPEECHFPHLVSVPKTVGCAHKVGLHDKDMENFKQIPKPLRLVT